MGRAKVLGQLVKNSWELSDACNDRDIYRGEAEIATTVIVDVLRELDGAQVECDLRERLLDLIEASYVIDPFEES